LIYGRRGAAGGWGSITLLGIGVALKLFPVFCISLAVRFSRRSFIVACAVAAFSLVYLVLTLKYVFLIRENVPTTFILSYGYKVIFLGVDHVRSEAGLSPTGLADTWAPGCAAALVLICAAALAINWVRTCREVCSIDTSVAGTAFLFGAGIYCGTYLLGTNFIYRLMFLLLCLPQLQDWQIRMWEDGKAVRIPEMGLLATVLSVLWLNGNATGHSIFLLLPQLLDWFLFFCLAAVLMSNLLRTVGSAFSATRRSSI
jgi:hypothetical protein